MNKAYKYLQRAVDLSPDDPMIILQLAIVELEGQRFEEAYDLLRRAYQIDPDNPEIIFRAHQLLESHGVQGRFLLIN